MTQTHVLFLLIGLLALALIFMIVAWALARFGRKDQEGPWRDLLDAMIDQSLGAQAEIARQVRAEMEQSARSARQELAISQTAFQEAMVRQGMEQGRAQNEQIDTLAGQVALLRATLSETVASQLQGMSLSNDRRIEQVRTAVSEQLSLLQRSNASQLEEMRNTVGDKLTASLHARLSESFTQVAQRLELVHRGLGEMASLAHGVGELKHLLTNVKTRGIFGEVQLATLLEQVFAPDQYVAQMATHPHSREMVDFALRLPGRGQDQDPLWLPIDAKFPTADYERLLLAQGRADAAQVMEATRALQARVRQEAKSIAQKYINPPTTTDFAVMFLPSEGLFAEVLRIPGLLEDLQRENHITLAGPTTLLALLSALQMGFRTLALERRSSEVWRLLGAVKGEFDKFSTVIDKLRRQTQAQLGTLDESVRRIRAIDKNLEQVQVFTSKASIDKLQELDHDGE